MVPSPVSIVTISGVSCVIRPAKEPAPFRKISSAKRRAGAIIKETKSTGIFFKVGRDTLPGSSESSLPSSGVNPEDRSVDVGEVPEKTVETVLQVVVFARAVLRAQPDTVVAGAEAEMLEGIPVDRGPAVAEPAVDAADVDVEVLPAQAEEERPDNFEIHLGAEHGNGCDDALARPLEILRVPVDAPLALDPELARDRTDARRSAEIDALVPDERIAIRQLVESRAEPGIDLGPHVVD